jgi:hypothetical protein
MLIIGNELEMDGLVCVKPGLAQSKNIYRAVN